MLSIQRALNCFLYIYFAYIYVIHNIHDEDDDLTAFVLKITYFIHASYKKEATRVE